MTSAMLADWSPQGRIRFRSLPVGGTGRSMKAWAYSEFLAANQCLPVDP